MAAPEETPGTVPDFYWQTARDSLLTEVAIQLFQIAAKHDGEEFDEAKFAIDEEYATLRGTSSARHGGKFQTATQAYQEGGWLSTANGKINITDAGHQALQLFAQVPDFLKVVPYFLVELLARYQLNNPGRPPSRNDELAKSRARSDIFPYWTIWKLMRECDNRLSVDELRRFVFRLQRSDDIGPTIQSIKAFRAEGAGGATEEQLNAKFPLPIEGATGEPKYWMGRAGAHIGEHPPLILKPDPSTYVLSEAYLPFIDEVLAHEPVYREELTEETWSKRYGSAVDVGAKIVPPPTADSARLDLEDLLDQNDALAQQVQTLIDSGSRSLILTGPPGTSKSWYARQLARRIVEGDMSRVELVQFHPSYGYEDFIEGFVPRLTESGLPSFERKWKVFPRACRLADDGRYAVLIIDEFSRGDAGRIFGEALTYIEPDYRGQPFKLASGRSMTVPRNLIIIGTMNPFDRSVSAVDIALQRRFEVLRLEPSPAILETLLLRNGMEQDLTQAVLRFFRVCQEVMPHGGLGHAYFLNATDVPSLKRIWTFRLAPLFDQELRFDTAAYQKVESAYLGLIGG